MVTSGGPFRVEGLRYSPVNISTVSGYPCWTCIDISLGVSAELSGDCGCTCMQVVETKIREVMHSRPRTCSSDIKAVDAMLVSTCIAGRSSPYSVIRKHCSRSWCDCLDSSAQLSEQAWTDNKGCHAIPYQRRTSYRCMLYTDAAKPHCHSRVPDCRRQLPQHTSNIAPAAHERLFWPKKEMMNPCV